MTEYAGCSSITLMGSSKGKAFIPSSEITLYHSPAAAHCLALGLVRPAHLVSSILDSQMFGLNRYASLFPVKHNQFAAETLSQSCGKRKLCDLELDERAPVLVKKIILPTPAVTLIDESPPVIDLILAVLQNILRLT